MTFFIQEASCLLPHPSSPFGLKEEVTDVFIKEGKIAAIGSEALRQRQKYSGQTASASCRVIKAKGLSLLPGIIDTQVHFRDPGLTHKEDFFHGSKGAILGGVTTVFDMPNTQPPTTTLSAFKDKQHRVEKKAWCNFALFAGASRENLSHLSEMEKERACCGVKIFMGSSTGSLLVEEEARLESILRQTRKLCAIHSEDEGRLRERREKYFGDGTATGIASGAASGNGHWNGFNGHWNHLWNMASGAASGAAFGGAITAHWHPRWRDVETALSSTRKILALAEKCQRRIHILHISTEEEITLLKDKKPLVSCEVLPQHLTFYAPECYDLWGNFAQMNPPLRERRHQEALWKAVQGGWVDVIGSDHAPHTVEEKQRPYPQSPSGITGVQTLLPVMLNHVRKGRLPLTQMVHLMSCRPAHIYQIPRKGSLQVGFDADLTLVDLRQKRTIEKQWIACKSPWTLYEGMKVQGWPVATFVQGQLAMYEDEVVAPEPCGKAVAFPPLS